MTKPLTQKQVAYQKADSMTAAEAATAAASLLPQSYCKSTERIGALFMACMRAGVTIYPDASKFDGEQGVPREAVAALPHAETCAFCVEKHSSIPQLEELELLMLRALAFVAMQDASLENDATAPQPACCHSLTVIAPSARRRTAILHRNQNVCLGASNDR